MTLTKKRLQKLEALKNHAWYKKLFQKISDSDLILVKNWIVLYGELPKAEFEFKANRIFLDQEDKPANHKIIWEFISTCSDAETP